MSKRSSPAPELQALGIPPPAGSIYELALTHRSYAFERGEPLRHNERLEFLGDAVLGLIVTDLVYRAYPDLTEGEMARLRASVVNTLALADLARSLELGDHILLGRGEEVSGGRDKSSLLADTFEALVGATYLERGLEELAGILHPLFGGLVHEASAAGGGHDAKTALQEVVVRARGDRPSYRVASSGPDHDKRFTARVYLGNQLYGTGAGRSKKEAEQNAAREALDKLEEDGNAADEHAASGAGGAPPGQERDARAS